VKAQSWRIATLVVAGGLAAGGGGTGCSDDPASSGGDSEPASSGALPTSSADSSGSGGVDSSTTEVAPPSRWIVTADFLAGTLSLVDYDALAAGERDPAKLVLGTIDLSAYAPGAMEVEIAPDGHTALVSVTPGFFDGIVGQTLGFTDLALDGVGLVVDLDTGEIVTELATAQVPLGFAFTPDGTRAFSCNFGHTGAPGSTMSVIDMQTFEVLEDVEVGGGPEQVALNEDGTLGILNVDDLDAVRVFETADPSGTLGEPLVVSDDPSGVAFVYGTDYAVVANSLGPSNWSVIDVSDPAAPTVFFTSDPPGGFPYGLTAIPGTTHVLLTLANDNTTYLRIDAATSPPSVVWSASATALRSFPMGIAVDVDAGLALSGAVGADALLVIPLDGSAIEQIAWPEPGPAYVAIGPIR
jgi:hypothetical protein